MQRFFTILTLTCAFFCLTVSMAFGEQYFESYLGYSAGSYPTGVATALLNGDAYLDLVVANYSAHTVSVLLGNGDGSFATKTDYDASPSQQIVSVDIADMDQDGELDIITGGSMGLVVFYGVGDGAFGDAQLHYFIETVQDVKVIDINHDAYPDIVTSHSARDSVGVHINDGDSTFTTHMVHTEMGTVSLAVGRFDNDDWDDVLVGCNIGRVWLLINDQSGSFTASEVHIGTFNDSHRIDAVDLNGDNLDDFVAVTINNDYLMPFINNGDSTFTVGSLDIVGDGPRNVKFADVNNDGAQDILVTISTTDEIEVYLNNGSNAFSYDTSYTVGGEPRAMVFADFNGDTYNDLAVASYTTDQVCILKSRLSLILDVDEIDTDGILPSAYALEQNYPNPFNATTKIRFALPDASHVRVEIFNILGQSVRVLVDEPLTAGTKEVTWDGLNDNGEIMPSGIFIYRISAENFSDTKRMVLLK